MNLTIFTGYGRCLAQKPLFEPAATPFLEFHTKIRKMKNLFVTFELYETAINMAGVQNQTILNHTYLC